MGCGAFCSYCGRCGRKVTDTIKWRVCRYCDYKNDFEATVCANCGRELPTYKNTIAPPPPPPPAGASGGLRSTDWDADGPQG
jgi:DNA-directed RNA polymerase subunit RPC12/RpoP